MKSPPPFFFSSVTWHCLKKLILMPDWFIGESWKRTVSVPRPLFKGWGMHRAK